MDHYIDIKVLPDPEFFETALLNALFAKLHRALVLVGEGEIGVSFPHVGKTLGDQIRLHGTKPALERLMADSWLKGLRDYTEASPITTIPKEVKHRFVKRVQAKSSAERLRRRSVAKGWLTEEEAAIRITHDQEKRLNKPFLQLKSQSTGQPFRLFIEHGTLVEQPVAGKFSAYGISSSATIPWWV